MYLETARTSLTIHLQIFDSHECFFATSVYSPEYLVNRDCEEYCFYATTPSTISAFLVKSSYADSTQTFRKLSWNHVEGCKYEAYYAREENATNCPRDEHFMHDLIESSKTTQILGKYIDFHSYYDGSAVVYRETDAAGNKSRVLILAKSRLSISGIDLLRSKIIDGLVRNNFFRGYFYNDIGVCCYRVRYCANMTYSATVETYTEAFWKNDAGELAVSKVLVGVCLIFFADRY